MNPRAVSEVVQETIDRNAWPIFYTHDVSEEASDFGFAPSFLKPS
jgi:hypothetical protein